MTPHRGTCDDSRIVTVRIFGLIVNNEKPVRWWERWVLELRFFAPSGLRMTDEEKQRCKEAKIKKRGLPNVGSSRFFSTSLFLVSLPSFDAYWLRALRVGFDDFLKGFLPFLKLLFPVSFFLPNGRP